MIRRIWRLYMGYLAIAFIVLVPAVSYRVVTHGLPKSILLFVIPAYVVLAIGFYKTWKALKPK